MHSKRSSGGFGVNPLQYSDIKAFFDLYDIRPEAWELSLIEALDNIALQEYADQASKEQKSKAPKKK